MESKPIKADDLFLDLPVFEIPQKEPPVRMSYEETIRASEELMKTMRIQEEPLRSEYIPRFEM